MTNARMYKACISRVHHVYTTFAVLCAAGAAQAGAWEEFEARCLTPMENIQPSITDGLPAGTETSLGDMAWMPDMEGTQYAFPDQPLVMVVASNSVTCMIIQTEPSEGDPFAPAEVWADENRTSGRYEDLANIQMGVRNINMGSTEWREPRMDMFGDAREGGKLPIFYVMETDLES